MEQDHLDEGPYHSIKASSRLFNERLRNLSIQQSRKRAADKQLARSIPGSKPTSSTNDTKKIDSNDLFTYGDRANVPYKIKVDEENEFGIGGVFLDPTPSNDSVASCSYRKWQKDHRQMTLPAHHIAHEWPLANMGLFASLPGELRTHIYELALVEPAGVVHITVQPGTCSLGPCVHSKLPTAVPGLLSTSRQIRYEAMPIFCTQNIFKFDAKAVRERCTSNWLRCLGHYGRLIPSVVLEVMVWKRIGRASDDKAGFPYEISILVNTHNDFVVYFDAEIKRKGPAECERLELHIAELDLRRKNGTSREEVLLEFLWSDWLADLVFRCKK